MPRYPISRATNFIVEDESWKVVEYDHTSVPGVIYLSLTENKVNLIYDDLVNDIADTDKLANYEILAPIETQVFNAGEWIDPKFTLTKNGEPCNVEVDLIPQDGSVVKVENGSLKAVGEGETDIIVRLKDAPSIERILHVRVGAESSFSAYIEGASRARISSDYVYTLVGTNDIDGEVNFFINEKWAKVKKIDGNVCTVHTNDKNELESFVLHAIYNGVEYTKEVQIIPLW